MIQAKIFELASQLKERKKKEKERPMSKIDFIKKKDLLKT
jgi:hypothetical protein